MGCGVSRPETDEGGEERGDFKIRNRQGSIGKDSETAGSSISDKEHLEISTHSKKSKTNGEKTIKEEESECKDHEEVKGDELKISPGSPSFRIYCVFPRDPNDDNIVDDLQRNKSISDQSKEQKGKRSQEAVGMKIRRRLNNVKKLLIPPTAPSSAANRS